MSLQDEFDAYVAARRRGAHPLLARFVAQERPEQAAVLAHDRALVRLVAVWPQAEIEWTPPEEVPDGLPAWRLWQLLWAGATIDVAALAAQMDVEVDLVLRKLALAKAARLVYPDGTVHGGAVGILHAIIARQVPAGARGSR